MQVAIQYRFVAAHNRRSDGRLEVPQGARASLLQLGCAVYHVRWQRSAVGNLVVIVGVAASMVLVQFKAWTSDGPACFWHS